MPEENSVVVSNIKDLVGLFGSSLLVAALVAAVCSILGVFVVLKRVVFIGITLSQAAACGVAAAMLWHFNPLVGAAALTIAVVALLAYPFESLRIPRDAVLGVIFVLTASLSILLVARSGFGLEKVKGMLFGSLLFATSRDLLRIACVLVPVLVYILAFLRPTLHTFLDREAARVLGVRVALWELGFFLALGLAVSAASKVAGSVLVFCYLVVAPASALLLSKRLWAVFVLSVAVAVSSTLVGMYWSYVSDLPTNQAVGFVSSCVFALVILCIAVARLVGHIIHHRSVGVGDRA